MSKDPAILFYTSDFLTGTILMDDAQVGKYIRLLCIQHQKGHLSKEDMLKICQTYDEDIFSKFRQDPEGRYYNEKLDGVIDKRKKYSLSRSKNRKGSKSKKDVLNTSSTYDNHMENENENENINRTGDGNYKEECKKIIDFLNSYASRKFGHTESNYKFIRARLSENYSVDDIKKVIKVKTDQWRDDDKQSKYIRPETLFNATKFQGYFNEAPSKEDRGDSKPEYEDDPEAYFEENRRRNGRS